MSNLVRGRMRLVGLGGMHTQPLGYIIIRIHVEGVEGYDKHQIAHIIPDLSKFASRVPITLGTLMIGRVINGMKESELNTLAIPLVNVWVTYLPAGQPVNPTNMNKIVKAKRSEKIEAFSFKVIHAQTTTMFVGYNIQPLPHGLAVQNPYTEMVTGSKGTVVVVLKNAPVSRVAAANAIPNAQIQPGIVEQLCTVQGIQTSRPKMTVEQWREVFFQQLDSGGLDSWTSKSRAAAHLLLAEYHDIFSLDARRHHWVESPMQLPFILNTRREVITL